MGLHKIGDEYPGAMKNLTSVCTAGARFWVRRVGFRCSHHRWLYLRRPALTQRRHGDNCSLIRSARLIFRLVAAALG